MKRRIRRTGVLGAAIGASAAVFLAAGTILTLACVAFAVPVDRTWSNPAGGSFQSVGNWSAGVVPDADDTAIFDASSSATGYTVTFTGSVVNDAMEVDDNLTLNLTGVSYLLNDTGTALKIGETNESRVLTVTNGTLSLSGDIRISDVSGFGNELAIPSGTLLFPSNTLNVAFASGSTGSVNVNGGFASGGSLFLGIGGVGSVQVNNGGTLALTGNASVSSGSISVIGGTVSCGTMLVATQNGDDGTLLLNATSSAVTVANALIIGQFGGSTGTVLLSAGTLSTGTTSIGGASSDSLGRGTLLIQSTSGLSSRFINTSTLTIGTGASNIAVGGNGTMIVNGTAARADVGTLVLAASNSNGTLIVSSGGEVNCGTLNVGSFGDGVLRVITGGDVTSTGSILMANTPNSTATVTVQGFGSSLSTAGGVLRVGSSGTATMNILDGGSVSCGIGAIATVNGAVGTVNISGTGSTWTTTSIAVSNTSTDTTAVLNVGPGGLAQTSGSQTLSINAGGTVFLNGGTISAGTLAINTGGAFNFDSGTLQITGTAGLSTGLLGPSFVLDADRNLRVTNTLLIPGSSRLTTRGGSINATTISVSSSGELVLEDATSLVNAAVNNSGVVRGNGEVSLALINNAGASAQVAAGQTMRFGGACTNNGLISLTDGRFDFGGALVNSGTGRVTGRGVLSSASTSNSGSIILSSGLSDVFGSLTNNSGGKTIVTGTAVATFYDPVTNNTGSEFRVSTNSTAAFLGPVSGLGQFTGPGTKIFESSASPGPVAAGGSTIVGPAGSLSATTIRETSLQVEGLARIVPNGTASGTSRLQVLTIDSGAFDLNDNDLVIDYPGATPFTTIRGYLAAGSLRSSLAAASTTPKTALGIAENSVLGLATFSGQPVDATSILIKYTYAGDANLDGQVDVTDLGALATNWQTASTWSGGDFNYDGFVDVTDLGALATNWQIGVGNPLGPARLDAALASVGLSSTSVPEPTALAWIMLTGFAGLSRRSRRARSNNA